MVFWPSTHSTIIVTQVKIRGKNFPLSCSLRIHSNSNLQISKLFCYRRLIAPWIFYHTKSFWLVSECASDPRHGYWKPSKCSLPPNLVKILKIIFGLAEVKRDSETLPFATMCICSLESSSRKQWTRICCWIVAGHHRKECYFDLVSIRISTTSSSSVAEAH